MPLSGSTDYSLTARDVVYDALRRCGVSDIYQAPNAEDASTALNQLELMLKHWQTHGPNLWLKKEGSLSLTQGTTSYTLPHEVLRALSLRVAYNGNEIPMTEMSRDEYFDLPVKNNTGYPTQFYFDAQRNDPVLYVWPTAANNGYSVNYTFEKRIDDLDSLDNEIEIAKENLLTVSYNLSSLLCDFYDIDNTRIIQRANQLLGEAEDFDREPYLQFVPGYC